MCKICLGVSINGEEGIDAFEVSFFRMGVLKSPEEKEYTFPSPPYNILLR